MIDEKIITGHVKKACTYLKIAIKIFNLIDDQCV